MRDSGPGATGGAPARGDWGGGVQPSPRSGLAGQEEKLLACVHCGFCLPACPTYRVLGDEADSPRGRLHLMRAVAEGRLDPGDPSFHTHVDRCLGCRACEPVCPSGVRYGELLEHAREEIARVRPPGITGRLLLWVFGRSFPNRWAGLKGSFLRATGIPALVARRLPPGGFSGLGRTGLAMLAASAPWAGLGTAGRPDAGGPGPEARAGTEDGDTGETRATPESPVVASRGSVGILLGCVQKGLFARVGTATRRTLAANGYRVAEVRDAGCCGALHAHAGALEDARAAARRHITAFEAAAVDWVAVDAAGCGAAMKGYGALLEDDASWRDRARAFAARVRDVSELLAMAGPRAGGPVEITAAYDPPCHLLHGQGVDAPVQAMLAAIPGLTVVRVPDGDRCCGGAGIYGLTHRDLGGEIARAKVRAVAGTGADVVLTGNPGCMMQIGGGLLLADSEMRVVHPVELLDESYRRGGVYERGTPDPRPGLP